MRTELTIALRTTVVTLLLTGLIYPLSVTGLAQLIFPARANGSLVYDGHGAPIGSALIGQTFVNPGYLHGRPSAAGNGYDAANSSGSNLGPTSKKLRDRVSADITRLRQENVEAAEQPIPNDLVTASASGLDPEVSPSAALWQVPRIARARQLAPERVAAVIRAHIQKRDLGFLGEPRVNVLAVNVALDQQFGTLPLPRAVAAPPPSVK